MLGKATEYTIKSQNKPYFNILEMYNSKSIFFLTYHLKYLQKMKYLGINRGI